MVNRNRFLELLKKHINNRISAEEQDELYANIHSGEYDDLLRSHILNTFSAEAPALGQLDKNKAEEIQTNILAHGSAHYLPFRPIKRFTQLLVAASILVVFSFSFYFFAKNYPFTGKEFVAHTRNPTDTVENHTRFAKIVDLEDGTSVTLFPGAVISYPRKFKADKREVNLKGKAFFNVSKRSSSHFYVYHENLTTHVLGTSFTISPSTAKETATVSVATGRVEVFERVKTISDNRLGKNGIVIYPNQKLQYHAVSRKFTLGLVEHPMPVVGKNGSQSVSFDFSGHTIKEVLTAIETIYQVGFVVEDPSILNCNFTGDLSAQDLYTKLDVICQSIGATYELRGTKIFITGKSCNH